jgi:lipopolysaccharide transport system permease protein
MARVLQEEWGQDLVAGWNTAGWTALSASIAGRIAQLSTDGIPPVLFYMLGTIAWAYFANCLDNTSKTFITNASILGKVYFHRLVIPLAAVASCAIAFSIQLLLFLATLAFYRLSGADVHFTAWVAAAPLMLAILAGYGLAGGIIVCAVTSKYRDLRHAVA